MNVMKPVRCLITAGPTREFIDPVRFVSNPSSGKMGYAIARAALGLDWSVDLVTGPVSISAPSEATVYSVVSAKEMYEQVEQLFDECDVFIAVAAVSDYSPVEQSSQKMKKGADRLNIEMVATRDILKEMSARKKKQIVVGFSAETENVEENAMNKLEAKGLNWIIANKVGGETSSFERDQSSAILLGKEGQRIEFNEIDKKSIADGIMKVLSADASLLT